MSGRGFCPGSLQTCNLLSLVPKLHLGSICLATLRWRGHSVGALDRIVYEVANSGPGIPAEEQKKVFQRFYRADKARSRSIDGLGLGTPTNSPVGAVP